jgi:DNA repair protein RecN (Recombination protein N)
MLSELRVRDLAVIADVTLPLRAGLNVLTGETGAGKSLLVDALALLLGERASVDVVRPGAEKTVIEGAFDLTSAVLGRLGPSLAALGVEVGEGLLVLKREIHREGRSRAWASGSPTTIGVLAQLGALLVDLHGQHETQSLLRPDAQRDMLDACAGAAVERVAVADAHERWQALERRETELRAKQEEVRRKADYLRHVAGEIERAAPRIGEDEALAAEARRLAHADELGRLGRELEQAVDATALTRARKLVAALERLDPAVARWQELVDGASANLEELAGAARAYVAGVAADPARLAEIEQRREVLYRLQQKHGPAIPDVLATRDAAARELELLDTADFDLRAIGEQRAAARADFDRAVAALTARRGAAATRLAAAVDELLPELGMPAGRFVVVLSPLPAPRGDGGEAVGFEIQLNPGLEPRPLARVASGGELSRLMLALKVVLAQHDAVPTLVFDEVDQGIGGEVGSRVGEALARVAAPGRQPGEPGERQVFVITHLPQIAARADHHIVVAKGAKGGVATSDVGVVTGDARRRELARMLGDADMATALRHAEELLRTASATPAAPPETRSRPGSGRSPRPR